MTFDDFLLRLFYLIDSALEACNLTRVRQRGHKPALFDSEAITMELAGEFKGLATDKAIWQYFRQHHLAEFPALKKLHRTTFARQAANLWAVKQSLHKYLASMLVEQTADPLQPTPLRLIDSFPLRVCRFKRAPAHKLFRGQAAYGRDPTGHGSFFGFRVHLCCSDQGCCLALTFAPANVPDIALVGDLLSAGQTAIADRVYWSPKEQRRLREEDGCVLLAPFKHKSRDPTPQRSALLTRVRQIIEPVIGQLATRFNCQRTWARDMWHLTSRLMRKILSHTTAMLLNARDGNEPLHLEALVQ